MPGIRIHGSYPASTSTQLKTAEGGFDAPKSAIVGRSGPPKAHWSAPERIQFGEVPQFEGVAGTEPLRVEAVALLEAAARGQAVDLGRAVDFAMRVIASTVIGRLALEVLKGVPFAPSRLVALAAAILVNENGPPEYESATEADREG
jgi:hypothetical protein